MTLTSSSIVIMGVDDPIHLHSGSNNEPISREEHRENNFSHVIGSSRGLAWIQWSSLFPSVRGRLQEFHDHFVREGCLLRQQEMRGAGDDA